MSLILKAALGLSIVILLLPADPKSGADAPRVSAVDALAAARTAVSDASGFCGRNPTACSTGQAVVEVFVDKARYGAGMIYHYFDSAETPAEPEPAPRDTLKTEDLAPAWRGAHSDRPA